MTEAEWLHGHDPGVMLRWLKGALTPRKFRLFVCACCRCLWDEFTPRAAREAIDVLERYADGLADEGELDAARASAEQEVQNLWSLLEEASGGWTHSLHPQAQALWSATRSAFRPRVEPAQWDGLWDNRELHCRLLRDVFGNPCRQAGRDRAWLAWEAGTLGRLAQAIYDERRFEDLPVLADALEEAGCDNRVILDHCRGGVRVRGCWVVDALLGKK